MILYTKKKPNGIEAWENIRRLWIDTDGLVYVDNSSKMDALRPYDYDFIILRTDTGEMIRGIKRMAVEIKPSRPGFTPEGFQL